MCVCLARERARLVLSLEVSHPNLDDHGLTSPVPRSELLTKRQKTHEQKAADNDSLKKILKATAQKHAIGVKMDAEMQEEYTAWAAVLGEGDDDAEDAEELDAEIFELLVTCIVDQVVRLKVSTIDCSFAFCRSLRLHSLLVFVREGTFFSRRSEVFLFFLFCLFCFSNFVFLFACFLFVCLFGDFFVSC